MTLLSDFERSLPWAGSPSRRPHHPLAVHASDGLTTNEMFLCVRGEFRTLDLWTALGCDEARLKRMRCVLA